MNAVSSKPRHTDVDSGALEKHTLRATMSPKMIHAMITGMVKDKNAYPIREIGKNCHEVSPKGKPWKLRLPDRLSNMAVFRNYGPPLSHRFMMERYPKMGDSTKDKLGVNGMSGLGLGSKSPFAKLLEDGQSGSYNVTNYDDGEARFYIISLTTDGQIQVKLMGRAETTEHDGLEVSFAIPERDTTAFQDAAYEVLWGFEPRPIITPRPNDVWSYPRIIERGPKWARYDEHSVPWTGVMVRVEHCILYPVDLDQVEGAEGILLNSDHIVFEVGQDDIQATSSREALQYTNRTRDTLKALIDGYADEVVEAAQVKVDQSTSYWEASWHLDKAMRDKTPGIAGRIQRAVSWRGRRLDEKMSLSRVKVMILPSGWDGFEKFSPRSELDTRDLIGERIVVQHGTDRTLERFAAHGLIGHRLIFLRIKRADFAGFKAQYALTDRDVTVLESIQLPPRPRLAPGEKPIKLRKLDVFTTGDSVHERREMVNIAEPAPFVFRSRRRRRRHCESEWSVGAAKVPESTFDRLMSIAIEAGLIPAGETVVCFRDPADVPVGWDSRELDFGHHLIESLMQFYDPTLTRSVKLGYSSLGNGLAALVSGTNIQGITLPLDLQDIAAKGRHLRDNGAVEVSEGLHDRIKSLLESCNAIESVAAPTLYQKFRKEYDHIVSTKYKALSTILDRLYYPNSEAKEALRHYIDVLVKAGIA